MSPLRNTGSPLVEVRTPTYRRPILLKRALSSLVAQTFPNWRCIVLDDDPEGSGTREICNDIGDQRIIYAPNIKNLGVGRNIDRAFSLPARQGSTHACVLEDDNYYLPDFLRSNLDLMEHNDVDIVLRNQLIERPAGRDLDGQVGPSTTFDNQYLDGRMTREEMWGSFFYSTAANNSSLFWRLDRGLSFETAEMTDDPVFQERLRTLCIDRDVFLALDPLVVWRDNGAESTRPKSNGFFSFFLSQTQAAARERRLYRELYTYLRDRGLLDFAFRPGHRTYTAGCERVFARCGIPSPRRTLLSSKDRARLLLLRLAASAVGAAVAEPVKYDLDGERIRRRSQLTR